jgi:tetratricopeptide (TPR) repeat protein
MSERKKKAQRRKERREGYFRQTLAPAGLASPSRSAMERMLRDMHKVIEQREFGSVEEVNRFLQGLSGDQIHKLASEQPQSPQEQAQELAYDAMEAETLEDAQRLAREALQLDPNCVDALAFLAETTPTSFPEYVSRLEEAVVAGERALGPEFFQENKGHFWGILKTRPYMRARYDFACLLRTLGATREAIRHFEALLELNPNDNQGVRDDLLGCYLTVNDLVGAQRLFDQYNGDDSAVFNWGRALGRYLAGNLELASKELERARQQNPHVEAYLSGQKKLPEEPLEFYSRGDETEAQHCAETLTAAWQKRPEAVAWLVETASST